MYISPNKNIYIQAFSLKFLKISRRSAALVDELYLGINIKNSVITATWGLCTPAISAVPFNISR